LKIGVSVYPINTDFLKKGDKMFTKNVAEIIKDGSETYEYTAGIIAAGTTTWVDVLASFPQARTFMPLDRIEVINNSAQQISLLLNSRSNAEAVPSYMIKPISRQPVRQFGLRNDGAVDTVAGDIIVHLRRLPPNVQYVTADRLER